MDSAEQPTKVFFQPANVVAILRNIFGATLGDKETYLTVTGVLTINDWDYDGADCLTRIRLEFVNVSAMIGYLEISDRENDQVKPKRTYFELSQIYDLTYQ